VKLPSTHEGSNLNWDQVVTEIGPRLYRYFSASFSLEASSDLTQDSLIRLVKLVNDGSYDESQGSLVMYAYGVARLVRLEAWRKQVPEDAYADPRGYDFRIAPTSKENSADDSLLKLRSAINELPETQKQIILLQLDDELSLEKIARVVSLPLNTVKSHIHRAKKILKSILINEGEL
jgi:RNA polymerase sigma factor (sigma-70 family)